MPRKTTSKSTGFQNPGVSIDDACEHLPLAHQPVQFRIKLLSPELALAKYFCLSGRVEVKAVVVDLAFADLVVTPIAHIHPKRDDPFATHDRPWIVLRVIPDRTVDHVVRDLARR